MKYVICAALLVVVMLAVGKIRTNAGSCKNLHSMYVQAVQNDGTPGYPAPSDIRDELNAKHCPLYP